MDTLQVAGMISKELKRSGVVDKAPQLASNIAKHFHEGGLTICNLKPLAELLGCEPEMAAIKDATHSLLGSRVSDNRRTYSAIAQALNWERTEFDTLDELLEELRATARVKYDELRAQSERLEACLVALEYYADTGIYLNGDVPGHVYVLDDNGSTAQVCLMQHGGRPCGGHIPARAPMRVVDVMNGLPPTYNVPCSLKHYMPTPVATTHTLLHAGELYRDVTILLRTDQLVAWRTADGQEYVAVACQVMLDPDEDGLAAAILSRIAGVEIAPEHMAELRAQMAGGML